MKLSSVRFPGLEAFEHAGVVRTSLWVKAVDLGYPAQSNGFAVSVSLQSWGCRIGKAVEAFEDPYSKAYTALQLRRELLRDSIINNIDPATGSIRMGEL